MNSDEKWQARKKKRRQQQLRLWLPVALVAALVVALTAGGVALSVRQGIDVARNGEPRTQVAEPVETPSGDNTQVAEPVEAPSGNDNNQAAEPVEAPSDNDTQVAEPVEAPSGDDNQAADPIEAPSGEDFTSFAQALRDKAAANQNFLKSGSEDLAAIQSELRGFSYDALSAEEKQLYDDLDDFLTVEIEGDAYAGISASGVPYQSVEGGANAYLYLLRKNSGSSKDLAAMQELLAAEINNNFGTMNALLAQDGNLVGNAAANMRDGSDEAYAYSTVTANSDVLKKAIACGGLSNGWAEFGLIRAYQMAGHDDLLRDYLIANTRMSYAMYGLCDIYVHYYGWTREQVIDLCSQYTLANQDNTWGANTYERVLQYPSEYASACIGYLELVDVEAVLKSNGGNEDALLSFLFDQGPASFRVYHQWLGV